MNRVTRLGLSALILATLVAPAAQAEEPTTLQNQPIQTTQPIDGRSNEPPTVQSSPQPTRIQAGVPASTPAAQPTSATVSERDRVQLEHYLQRPLPVGLENNQVNGI